MCSNVNPISKEEEEESVAIKIGRIKLLKFCNVNIILNK